MMPIVKLTDILAVQIVHHCDIASKPVAQPALLAVDEYRDIARIVLAEPLGGLAATVARASHSQQIKLG
jgi:hypothetical protein